MFLLNETKFIIAPIIQINRHTKTASSEPKLFMKGTVFSRQKAMRHTFRFHQQQDPNGNRFIIVFLKEMIFYLFLNVQNISFSFYS